MLTLEKYIKNISPSLLSKAKEFLKTNTILKLKSLDKSIIATVIDRGIVVETKLNFLVDSFRATCSCGVLRGTLCHHSVALLLHHFSDKGKVDSRIVVSKRGWEQLLYQSTSSANLIIIVDSLPQANKDWDIKVQVKDQKKIIDAEILRIAREMVDSNGISFNDFSWQEQEVLNFINEYCILSKNLFTVPHSLVHNFLLTLVNFKNLFIGKESFDISSEKPKLVFEVTKNDKFCLSYRWSTIYSQELQSYYLTSCGVWLQLDKYYYFPFFAYRTLIMNLLNSNELNFDEQQFYILNKKLQGLKEYMVLNIKESEENNIPCIPVLQLNWSNLFLEAYLSFEYMGRQVSDFSDHLWVKKHCVIRNKKLEDEARDVLLSFGFIHQENNFYTLNDVQDVGNFIDNYFKNLCRDWRIFSSQNFNEKIALIERIGLKINNVSASSYLFQFDVEVQVDNQKIINWRKTLFSNRQQNDKYVLLDNGSLARIDDDVDKTLQRLKAYSKQDNYRLAKYMSIPLFDSLLPYTKDKKSIKSLYKDITDLNIKNGPVKNIPAQLLKKLRPYQKDGISWLQAMYKKNLSCILADEMGLGKTIQSLAFLASQKNNFKTLIVSPKSLTENWLCECQRFTPSLKAIVLNNFKERQQYQKEIEEANIIIISYRLLHFEFDYYSQLNFDCLILDEAQYIKNHNSLTTQCCRSIRADFKLLLTGTPIENSILDIWTLFDFMICGYLGTLSSFKKKFYKVNNDDQVSKLSQLISPFILRRYKKDVLAELPSKQQQIIVCDLLPEQKKLYDTYLYEVQNSYSWKTNKLQIFAILMKLKQICCSPRLILPKEDIKSAKFELLKQIIRELQDSNHRTLIFSQFTSMLLLIRQWFDEEKIAYLYLDGSTKNRQGLIEKFNNSQHPFFLISLKAGGVGVNLTGADTVIHYDLWWNPMVEDQATDRVHRIGQQRKVNIIKLVTKETIEDKIMAIQHHKRKLFYNLLENPTAIKGLTSKDLEFLIS